MPNAHLYLYSDACPSDWLVDDHDEEWHTIANFVFQSDPALQLLIEQGKAPHEVLALDTVFTRFITKLQSHLPASQMRKWKNRRHRLIFCKAFSTIVNDFKPIVSALSFQEKTLRTSKQALLQAYNQHIGGIEGKGIGFKEFKDRKGRLQMRHSFVNFHGYHQIQCPENQMLVLLLMSWFIADQYIFYRKEIIDTRRYGFDNLALTIVSDKLSGDNDFQQKSEQNLRNLIDPDGEGIPIVLTRSPQSDVYPGDLLVDNLAGWLNAAISDPAGKLAQEANALAQSGVWKGWYILLPSESRLESTPAISQLSNEKKPNKTLHASA